MTDGTPEGGGPPAPPAPPPVAEIVVTGTKTERELQLEKDLEDERKARKKVESDNAQLTDEVHRLTTPPPPPTDDPSVTRPTPKPKPRKRGPLGVRA